MLNSLVVAREKDARIDINKTLFSTSNNNNFQKFLLLLNLLLQAIYFRHTFHVNGCKNKEGGYHCQKQLCVCMMFFIQFRATMAPFPSSNFSCRSFSPSCSLSSLLVSTPIAHTGRVKKLLGGTLGGLIQ